MAGLRFAAVVVHLCLLVLSCSALRWLSDPLPESAAGQGHESYKTAYHFRPTENWQNDPNGPMYYKGVYHFFYQYNPYKATWGNGNLSWGHSVSLDLVNWSALDNAMDPDSPFDANGCWSGSATFLADGTPVFLYTGIDDHNNQVQNVAFPKNASDPLLREWVKPSYNPVIALPDDVVHDNFRDPTTAWIGRDGLWRVAVSAGFKDGTGSTLVYRSKDFRSWERNPEPICWKRFQKNYRGPERSVGAAYGNYGNYGVDTNWYTDSGATDHITGELEKLHVRDRYNGNEQIHTASGSGHEGGSTQR